MKKILVTGATGFVGRAVCSSLSTAGHSVRGTLLAHEDPASLGRDVEAVLIELIGPSTPWRHALVNVAAVIHLAARVHVMNESASDPLAEFRRVNVDGTLHLARQAAVAGVQRFVFVSSIGVNGAETFHAPFTAEDIPDPRSPYAVSKYEAEIGLQRIAQETGLQVVVIRPPLVVGPNAPGNLNMLLKAVYRGVPLPLGAIYNKRSLVALDNLVDLIVTCLHHHAAANQTFVVSDGEDLSTTELLRRTAAALGRPLHLIPVPATILRTAARLIGKTDMAQQLCGSLQVDMSKTRQVLDWSPPTTVDQALRKTAQHFVKAASEKNS